MSAAKAREVVTTSATKKRAADDPPPAMFARAPAALSHAGLMLQRKEACACDGGCLRCAEETEHKMLQARLRVGTPGDRYEQEADRVAEQVMRTPDYRPATGEAPTALASSLTIKRGLVGRKSTSGGAVDGASSTDVVPGGGRPLPPSERAFFESRFGRDFGGVRVHADGRAAELARSLNARAYTAGRDIVFGEGQYSSATTEGRKLLAHELAHVIQQSAGGGRELIQRQGPSHDLVTLPAVAAVNTPDGVDLISPHASGVGLRVIAPTAIDRRHFAHEMSYRPGDILHVRPLVRIVKTPDITVVVFGTLAP